MVCEQNKQLDIYVHKYNSGPGTLPCGKLYLPSHSSIKFCSNKTKPNQTLQPDLR